jgi:phage anti-repressor protein
VQAKSFVAFEESKLSMREVGLKSQKQWLRWCRDGHRPADIPYNPNLVYKGKGWVSWADWLGYDEGKAPVSRSFLEFEEARELVRAVGLESKKQWEQWCRDRHRPADIPSNPDVTYRGKGWVSWPDWLGYDEGRAARRCTPKEFLPFEEARELVRAAGLGGWDQWRQWCIDTPRPDDIPSNPERTYADKGWVSWADWLGYDEGKPARGSSFLDFEEARELVRAVGLQNKWQWHKWCRDRHRPAGIPSDPHTVYKDKGWVSYPDWLGYGKEP